MVKALILGFFVILGADFLALANRWYLTFPWFDSALHFLGGVWVGLLFYWLFKPNRFDGFGFWSRSVFIVSFVVLIGVLWEFAEYVFLNQLMAKFFDAPLVAGGLTDTLTDLFFDLVGGSAIALFYKSR